MELVLARRLFHTFCEDSNVAGFTNRGKKAILDSTFHADALPSTYKLHLVSTIPDADTNTLGDLTEISGGGYAAKSLSKNSTDFNVGPTEDDSSDIAYVRIANQSWTASGGSIGEAKFMVLTDDNATESDREVWGFFDLRDGSGNGRTVTDGQSLTVQNAEIRLSES